MRSADVLEACPNDSPKRDKKTSLKDLPAWPGIAARAADAVARPGQGAFLHKGLHATVPDTSQPLQRKTRLQFAEIFHGHTL